MTSTGATRPGRVMFVVGTTRGGTGTHVLMLAAGLGSRAVAVSVAGPPAADDSFSFSSLPSAAFFPVAIGDRPRVGDAVAVWRLRRLLARWAAAGPRGVPRAEADVVHAHGLRAGAFTVLALAGGRRRAGLPVVVTVHNAPPAGSVAGLVYRALEWLVARGADLVLCVSPDLEEAVRAAGARRVARAVVAVPSAPVPAAPVPGGPLPAAPLPGGPLPAAPLPGGSAPAAPVPAAPVPAAPVPAAPAAGGPARPVVLAVGRLAAQKGFGTLLDAAAQWQELTPRPRLVIAGDGPLAGELRLQAAARAIDVAFLGQVSNVPALLAGAAVFVMPSWWEGQPLVLQEALRAGAPIVATSVGGVPDLVGQDAALLVEPRDAAGLAAAVLAVLSDPALAARLRAAAARRAARLPTEADAVVAALAAYAVASG